jgi:hypothetical protein
MEESLFHFKFRHSSPNVLLEATDDSANWYGYCLFRQKRDTSVKRHYVQKSLILLSQHDFPPLFSHIVETVSMLEFSVSPALIESACSNIADWGPPQTGIRELPFLGEILEVHMSVLLTSLPVPLYFLGMRLIVPHQTTPPWLPPSGRHAPQFVQRRLASRV